MSSPNAFFLALFAYPLFKVFAHNNHMSTTENFISL
jgi:hypothetical protein